MPSSAPVVDSDGHIIEPPDLWQRYLEKDFVDRAIRIEVDENGLEVLVFDDQPLEFLRGMLGGMGGIEQNADDVFTPGIVTYLEGCAFGSSNPGDRLQVMDKEQIDIALFYPTIGICWEGWIQDPALATAYTRAYNRWIVDFCSENPSRLKAVAHINLLDPAAACVEARRAREDGCVGVMLAPDPFARGGRMLNDRELAPFWSTLQELDMPMSFHVVARPEEQNMLAEWLRPAEHGPLESGLQVMSFAFLSLNVMAAFTQLLSVGVLEEYPRLKCGVLETGATWISAWLDRMDGKHETMQSGSPLKMLPSEYFFRQCLISADPDETMTAACVDHLGADYFTWASDYPHLDASFDVVNQLRDRLKDLPEADQAKVMGENAVRFYGL
jgi:predicted TIM-barrel fold metal-dependent hydrolase